MTEGKDTRSFFRKVVGFVVNPRGEAAETGPPDEGGRESEFAKSELKAMIERKRRNDFVRKRELDLLRKLRREGLTPEQLAALGSSSGMADTQLRGEDAELSAEPGMVEKIDEIELQMAAHAVPAASRRLAGVPGTPASKSRDAMAKGALARSMADTVIDAAQLDAVPANSGLDWSISTKSGGDAAPVAASRSARGVSSYDMPGGRSPNSASAVEVTEAGHDPELDEAVIAYANGDAATAEALLLALIGAGGSRRQHSETWMVVFDLYRGTGQKASFETLAAEYSERFGLSAPHWFSVPKMIEEAAAAARPAERPLGENLSWACPVDLDAAAVAAMRERIQMAALPWVFDWTALERIDDAAIAGLLEAFTPWVERELDMHWIGGGVLLSLLAEATPIAEPQVEQRVWQLRLLLLRLLNRPEKFDEVAIDYCVTYEISPPSWETTKCRVRVSGPFGPRTSLAKTTMIGGASTSFVESELADEPGLVQMVSLELAGQMVGDVSTVLRRLDAQIDESRLIELSCIKLLRVDFMASGELLNWVLAHERDKRRVCFVDTNRLVAKFFSAVGIDTYATVKVSAV